MSVSVERTKLSVTYSDGGWRACVDLTGVPQAYHECVEHQILLAVNSARRSAYETGVRDAQAAMRKALGLSDY